MENDFNLPFENDYFKTGSARAKNSSAVAVPSDEGSKVEFGVVIQSTPQELYGILRDVKAYRAFIPNLQEVEEKQPGRSRWALKGSGDKPLVWNVEIITEKENQLLAWRSNDPSDIASAGSIRLKALPNSRGTELRITMKYDVPNENLKATFKKIFGESAEDEIRTSVRRFKALVETGEIPSTEGQPRGGFPAGASDSKNSYKLVGQEESH